MKKIMTGLAILTTIATGFSSCYYDVESQIYPDSNVCDTTNVTYSTTVKGILQNNSCMTCHSGSAAAGGGIVLDTYTGVKTVAQNGGLYGAVTHSASFTPMPQSGGKLSNCDISKLKTWIDAGNPNN